VSRYREYRRIKAMLLRYGFSERILEPLARSRCQRDAALLAANEAGHGDCARAYFTALGYRWYHILPDSVVTNPLAFLRPSFLRSSFLPGKKGLRREAAHAKRQAPPAAPEPASHTGHHAPGHVPRHDAPRTEPRTMARAESGPADRIRRG
jgi:hypothetical protein